MATLTSNASGKVRLVMGVVGVLTVLGFVPGAGAQTTYYYYPSSAPAAPTVTVAAPGNATYYYYQRGLFGRRMVMSYAPQQYVTVPQAAESVQPAAPEQYQETAFVAPTTGNNETAGSKEGQKTEAKTEEAATDPYGFTSWLNSTRAAYGLPPVGYDQNLSNWAASNNEQQAARGLGHFVMGPARRQNAAVGGYPGVETMWMNSPAHRAALLDPTIRWIGIAGLGAYWTFNAN